ncbi:gp0.45 [Escherichia phage 13a]|uniref:Gp0.45 n=1 Tax=Escherichia phage 13a TaxID=532076 RepID=B3VD29_9CAUD|nr:gp0.45 [Escherichia phage 13a]ACF15884.1 gp0.45 [Escherichia phage 13a]
MPFMIFTNDVIGANMSKLIASSKLSGCYTVTLREHLHGKMGSTYTVRYGKQVSHFVNERLAHDEYLACVHHQRSCAGWE